MSPLSSHEIRGNWAAVLLPMAADDSIDFDRLTVVIERLLAARVDGVYTNGTAGEFYNQSEQEFVAISKLVAERCEAAGMPFQLGATSSDPTTALERVRIAAALRPSAIQVVLPDWFPVTDHEAIVFLQRVAHAAAPTGLVLYNPPHAKRVLTPTNIGVLAQAVPELVGVKVAGGDAAWYAEMRSEAGGLSLFVPGHHLATGLQSGAAGSYSNVACLSPGRAQWWADLARNDLTRALEIESRIRALMDQHIVPLITEQHYSNQAVDKLLAAIGDWAPVGTRLRWPYRWIEESVAAELRPVAHQLLPEFFPA